MRRKKNSKYYKKRLLNNNRTQQSKCIDAVLKIKLLTIENFCLSIDFKEFCNEEKDT